ncbi:MAG TPA: flagellar hook-associated protein FlgL [Candidatus Paceibacterota bacterium]|nr:flagellar hook-associated protein FlgL [Candidatus Paceibacterota bacterium]
MRVTGNTFSTNFLSQVNRLTSRQQQLQNQATTGQRIAALEDDPAAMQRVLGMESEQTSLSQYKANISALKDRAMSTFNNLKAVKTVSDRVGEIATQADGTRSNEELKTYASEITQLIKQAVQTMNSKQGGEYVFGGTSNGQEPFTLTTDANGNVTSVTYNGNTSVKDVEIASGSTIAVDVPGENNSGNGPRGVITDSRSGADFFNHLISLQDNLLAGDTAAIAATDRPNLTTDEENLIFHISNNGVLQSRLETATTAASTRSESLDQMISKEADADLTTTLVSLSQTQTAYQAALQSGASLMKLSLLNYL